jgi:hypothetical protein
MDLYREYAIAPARHVAALWHRLGRYLSHADQRAATTLTAKHDNGGTAPEKSGSSLPHHFLLVVEGDDVPNHEGGPRDHLWRRGLGSTGVAGAMGPRTRE